MIFNPGNILHYNESINKEVYKNKYIKDSDRS